jgi:hypothetical protein
MSRSRKQTEDEFAVWVESPEGKAAIKAQYEKRKRKGPLKKGRAYEMIEAAGLMNVPVSLRIPVDDLQKARAVAERKGIPYQTYIKMVLHEALAKEPA